MEIRKDVQLLRGLAVLVVVLFHLQIPFFENGFLGVDIFFVISGFLMAKLYNKGSTLDFYKRRIDRLFPAYALTLLVTLVAGYFLLIPVDFSQLFEQTIAGAFFVPNIFYWNQNSYFDKSAFNPLLNLWSLGVEVQFYLIVPILYPLLRHRKWLFYTVFIVSLASCLAVQMISPKTSFFHMPLRVWEFLIGAWVAWQANHTAISSEKSSKLLQLFFISSLVALPFLIVLKPNATGTIMFGHPAAPALVITLLAGLVIKFGIPNALLDSIVGRSLSKIGDYSYSIYLIHFPVIVLINYVPFGGTRLAPDSYSALLLAVALISLISAFSYIYVERKFSRTLNLPTFRFSMLLLVLASALVLSSLNMSKYNAAQRNIFSAWTDRNTYRCGKVFRLLNPTEIVCGLRVVDGEKRVLLIGNSHADSIKKIFADKAAETGISTFFAVANDPLMGGGPNAEQFISVAIKHGINSLVLHYSDVYSRDKSRSEILKLVGLANKNNIKVFLIGPVPTYGVSIPQAMFGDLGLSNTFAITRNDHFKKTQQYRNLVTTFEAMGVTVYDPSSLLCPSDGSCLFSTPDSKPYYFDSNHLTLTGSSRLSPLFEDLLKHI